MGCRLHVAKTYNVKYADGGCFNWQIEEINDLIGEHCDDAWFSDSEYPSSSYEIEVAKDEFKNLIDWLRTCSVEEYTEQNETLSKACTKEYVADNFQYFLDNGEPETEYLRLSWF